MMSLPVLGCFLRHVSSVCSTGLEKRGPIRTYSRSRSRSSRRTSESGDLCASSKTLTIMDALPASDMPTHELGEMSFTKGNSESSARRAAIAVLPEPDSPSSSIDSKLVCSDRRRGHQLPLCEAVLDHAAAHADGQVVLRDTERGLHLIERQVEIGHHQLHVVQLARLHAARLGGHVPLEGEARRRLDEALDLGARKVFGRRGERGQRDVLAEAARLAHRHRVDVEDLQPPLLVGQRDLDLHLEPAGAQQGLVNHVLPVGHADDKDIVERVDAVNLGEELVDDRVAHARAVTRRAACLAHRVDLVKDDDVKVGVVAALVLFGLGVRKQVADVLL
mmetsp:Transcript_22607/g.55847  ORF Transcript_22607/g.55847 Transcript_22607/m.55847 type:complete len:334 (+) Transcript_22607:966-1967(+)